MDESVDNKIYLSTSLFGNHKEPQVTLSAVGPVRLQKIRIGKSCGDNEHESEKKSPCGGTTVWSVSKEKTTESIRSLHNSHAHSKKGIKHALRQQAKRRRKNTTIAAGNSAPLPRYVTPTSADSAEDEDTRLKQPTTMNDILTSIPGFCIKHRKRTNKKLSTAAQLEQTKEGCIDLETPDSILVQTNLRDLLNEPAFLSLPPLYQYKLVQLLPPVDRISVGSPSDCVYKLSSSGLNNEFFKSACSEWKDRLAEGEFTPENQQKRKLEAERERNKLDPWKVKHFEPIWGENANIANSGMSPSDKDSISPRSAAYKNYAKRPPSPALRNRTVGAVTRSVSMYREKRETEDTGCDTNKKFKPASNPSPNYLTQFNMEGKGNNTYEKKHRLDKALEIKIVESRHEHRDRQEIPLIKAVQFEPDLSMCSILGTKALQGDDNRDVIDSTTCQEEINLHSDAIEASSSIASVTTINPIVSRPSSITLSAFLNTDFSSPGSGNDSTEQNANIETKDYGSIDTIEEVIITEKDDNADLENDVEIECKIEESYEYDGEENKRNSEDQEAVLEKLTLRTGEYTSSDVTRKEQQTTEPNTTLPEIEEINDEESSVSTVEEKTDEEEDGEDASLLDESVNIEKMICEGAENWGSSKEDQEHAAILAAAWDAVDSSSENLLAEVNLTANVFGEDESESDDMQEEIEEQTEIVSTEELITNARNNEIESIEVDGEGDENIDHTEAADENVSEVVASTSSPIKSATEKPDNEVEQSTEKSEDEPTILEEHIISIDRIIGEGEENWDNSKEEQVQAAILAAAWNAVDSSTEKLLAEAVLERETEVAVIPMQEELEVKLEVSSSPAPDWAGFSNKVDGVLNADPERKSSKVAYAGGHVKLELEVTLTPEVDSQVSSTADGGTGSSTKVTTSSSTVITPSTVIPPTTIVCLPTTNSSVPPPPTTQIVTSQAVSSSALPYIALTTSTPVRAVPTKTQTKSGGRGGRSASNKPPPGAVNLERSYQICQAVIQNSPNRDQLKFQLKPPPALLMTNKEYTKPQTSSRGNIPKSTKGYNSQPAQNPMLVKHVFTSAQGIPVTMAVLPPSNTELTESQMGQYVLVQRSGLGSGIRRSNSAPPSNQKSGTYGIGGRGRPASVGMQHHQQQAGTQPGMRTIVTNPNGPTYYSVPQQYSLVTRVNNDCSGCSRKAMVMCKKCGAFCHDDCIEPYKMCVNCR